MRAEPQLEPGFVVKRLFVDDIGSRAVIPHHLVISPNEEDRRTNRWVEVRLVVPNMPERSNREPTLAEELGE